MKNALAYCFNHITPPSRFPTSANNEAEVVFSFLVIDFNACSITVYKFMNFTTGNFKNVVPSEFCPLTIQSLPLQFPHVYSNEIITQQST